MSQDAQLKRITPFSIRIHVEFAPDTSPSGYRPIARGVAEIGDKQVSICVSSHLAFRSAQLWNSLRFDMSVVADAILPLVNKANKE
jgi:hypothetical protein